jgi:NAD(P)H-hydrate epimerase
MRIATAEAMKAMDGYAIHGLGISSTLLMENAARAVTDAVLDLLGGKPGRAVVFCGSGNNGGDGVAAARFLLGRGCTVRCFLTGRREKLTADTAEMERRLIDADGCLEPFTKEAALEALESCDVLVDALFGTGLNSDLRGDSLVAVRLMNACPLPVVSCDIPSGIEANTGHILGDAVQATVTVTFSMAKPGLLLPPGMVNTGKLVIADIAIPADVQDDQPTVGEYVTEDFVRARLPERPRDSHKGDFGKVLLLCGSTGFTGAAVMASKAALRTGAGLVSLGVPASLYPIVAVKAADEVMVFPLPCDEAGRLTLEALPEILRRLSGCDACLLGPGLGRSEDLTQLVAAVVSQSRVPMVVDADGINALSGHIDVVRGAACPVLLTPHDGEFARLGGDLEADRFTATQHLAQETGAVVVRKGYRTVTADGESLYVNSTGNPGMATGGSGDVLSGILLALLGQGLPPVEAAACGVWLHGAAGDRCAAELGEYGMLPTDLIEALPRLLP